MMRFGRRMPIELLRSYLGYVASRSTANSPARLVVTLPEARIVGRLRARRPDRLTLVR